MEFLNKNKYGLLVLVLIAAAAIHYFFFYKSCTEPSEMRLVISSLKCIQTIMNQDPNQIQAEFCEYIGQEANCAPTEEDRPKAQEFVNKKMTKCMIEELKQENFCTDKLAKEGWK